MVELTSDQLKQAVGRAALAYVEPGQIVGVGTGTTVAHFITGLGEMRHQIPGAVSSSERSTAALKEVGIPVLPANEVESLSVYVDGTDEIDPNGYLIKGGGAALTREKIVASLADRFICIAEEYKSVPVLGDFTLPVEVIPEAEAAIARRFAAGLQGTSGAAVLRRNADGTPLITDNGQHILDIAGLKIADPLAFESAVNDWPGVVTVGVFAHQKASIALLGGPDGVRTVEF